MFNFFKKTVNSNRQEPKPTKTPTLKQDTVFDMTETEINDAIKAMDSRINLLPGASRFKDLWLKELVPKERTGGKRKTRKIRHRFTQNRK
jgi:hypothetical protein